MTDELRCKKQVDGLDVFLDGYRYCVMQPCLDCGQVRKVRIRNGKSESKRCRGCSAKVRWSELLGDKNPFWKGGRTRHTQGYILVSVPNDSFFASMVFRRGAKGRERLYILEHRLVMAKHLGRCLQSWEIIHHKNGIKDDNGIANLQLVSDDRHKQITLLENRIKRLEGKVILLEAENVLLGVAHEARDTRVDF
ncbi:hypothetical protein LCGC14_0572260 [marine sediment metagenome]|uniref:HNH nuclease domain-containing protein n=1 Tax=marine sediment metagenome TaxID=412755 RepID=A0A0F9US39_9ZZZZ